MKTIVESFVQSLLSKIPSFGVFEPKEIVAAFEKSDAKPAFLEKYRKLVETCSLKTLIEHHMYFQRHSSGGNLVCAARNFFGIVHEKLFKTNITGRVFTEKGIEISEILYLLHFAEKDLKKCIEKQIVSFFLKKVLSENLTFQYFTQRYSGITDSNSPKNLYRCKACICKKLFWDYLQTIKLVGDLKRARRNYEYFNYDFLVFERLDQILALQSLTDLRMLSERYGHVNAESRVRQFTERIFVFTKNAEQKNREKLNETMTELTTLVQFIILGKEIMTVSGAEQVFAKLLQQDRPGLAKSKAMFDIYSESEVFIATLTKYYQEEIPKMEVPGFGILWNYISSVHESISKAMLELMIKSIALENDVRLLGYPMGSCGFENEDVIKAAVRKRISILIEPFIGEEESLEKIRSWWSWIEKGSKIESVLEKRYEEILQKIDSLDIVEKILPQSNQYWDKLHKHAIKRYGVLLSKYLKGNRSLEDLYLRRRKVPYRLRGGIDRELSRMIESSNIDCLVRFFLSADMFTNNEMRQASVRFFKILPYRLAQEKSIDELIFLLNATRVAMYYCKNNGVEEILTEISKWVKNEESPAELFRVYSTEQDYGIMERCSAVLPNFLLNAKCEQEIKDLYEACPEIFKGEFLAICRNVTIE